ncbi:MAG: isocitrate/isopropylmalate family dehydrogenase, partial [Pirellulales bacterium]
GKNLANPIAQIASAALMLQYSFGLNEAGVAVHNAIAKVIADGLRTGDIYSAQDTKARKVGTSEMGDAIARAISG